MSGHGDTRHVARGPGRPLLYKTLGLVNDNQTLREAANGVIMVGTAVGEGYVTAARPSSADGPVCQRKCAAAGGCVDRSSTRTLCGCASDGATVLATALELAPAVGWAGAAGERRPLAVAMD